MKKRRTKKYKEIIKDNRLIIGYIILFPIILFSLLKVISSCGMDNILLILFLFFIGLPYGYWYGYKCGKSAARKFLSKKWFISRKLIYIALLVSLFFILNILWSCNIYQIILSICILILDPFIGYWFGHYFISRKRERIRRGHF